MASVRPRAYPEHTQSHGTWVLKSACPRTSTPYLFLCRAIPGTGHGVYMSMWQSFPHPHFSLANQVLRYIWIAALSHQGLRHQLVHLQTGWETCDRMGSTSRISLILEPPLPIRDPHWLAGTTSRSVTGGLLVAGLLLMELMMS